MLFGQHFGRGHDGGLVAVIGRHDGAQKCDEGFPGADVALQEPAHGSSSFHVAPDLPQHLFLSVGEFKRQPFQHPREA